MLTCALAQDEGGEEDEGPGEDLTGDAPGEGGGGADAGETAPAKKKGKGAALGQLGGLILSGLASVWLSVPEDTVLLA